MAEQDQKAVYSVKITVRSDMAIKVPTLEDTEAVIEVGLANYIIKQNGGMNDADLEVNADAERVDK